MDHHVDDVLLVFSVPSGESQVVFLDFAHPDAAILHVQVVDPEAALMLVIVAYELNFAGGKITADFFDAISLPFEIAKLIHMDPTAPFPMMIGLAENINAFTLKKIVLK